MVVAKIASIAQLFGIHLAISVNASGGHALTTSTVVAVLAEALRIMLLIKVLALCHLHNI